MHLSARDGRRSSNSGIASSHTKRLGLKSSRSGEGLRNGAPAPERDRTRLDSRVASEANLNSLYRRHRLGDDSSERPVRMSRRASRNSKTSLVSYGAKVADNDSVCDINIAVLGNRAVGKTTFVRRALDLDETNPPSLTCRILAVGGKLCMVRMIELNISDVYEEKKDSMLWPHSIDATPVHGVVTLYDVGNNESFHLVPEVLNAVNRMSLPSALAACKCDLQGPQRQIEPRKVEHRASSAFENVATLQLSQDSPDLYRKAISVVLKNIVGQSHTATDGAAGPRRTTLPTISPGHLAQGNSRPPAPAHSRSTSEIPGSRRYAMNLSHLNGTRFDHATALKSTSNPRQQPDDVSSSLVEESHTDDSGSQTSKSNCDTDASDIDNDQQVSTPRTPSEDNGWTFDALVNRLLALPTSKADSKFAAVFLALYRKFAPPGQLLEAIVVRFESIEHTEPALLARTVAQLRYLTVVEQWIHLYPGDFAHIKTLRRIRTFIAKLQKSKIFATAAKEMNNNLEFVAEDDDTEWACCDKSRLTARAATTSAEYSYRGSLLIDDPNFELPSDFGDMSLKSNGAAAPQSDTASVSSAGRKREMQFEDVAQREASKLVPQPRNVLNKHTWRALLDTPHDTIAKEMTRIDWIMFASMRPRDLVRQVSLTQGQKAECKSLANVSRMIDHFNYVRDWVINFVLYRDKPKHRVLMLEKFIRIARTLRELNNYNSLGAVLAGIHSTSVHRLNATKELINVDLAKDAKKLEILMAQTRSFSAYRLAWENSQSERIPYLPLSIRDLIGAESGNKTFLGDDSYGHINWRKFEVMGDVLVSIQRAQGLPYRGSVLGHKNDEVRKLLLHTKISRDDDQLYERSVQLEAAGTHGHRRGFKDFFQR